MSEFVQYRRTQIAEMADWAPGFDMSGVSISEADRKAGSPKTGDKIARNPANHEDRWLVAAEYFASNFEALASAPQASQPPQGAPRRYGTIAERAQQGLDAGLWEPPQGAGLPLSVRFSADYLRAYMEGELDEARRHLDKLIAALAASPPPATQEPVAWRAWAPGFSSHFVLLADEESAKSLAVKFGDGKYEPLYAAPAPVSPEERGE